VQKALIKQLILTGVICYCASIDSRLSAAETVPAQTLEVRKLRIVPEKVALWGAGAGQRVLVMAECADRIERDVTDQAGLTLDQSEVACIGEDGRVHGVADGETILRAEFAGIAVQAHVHVEQSGVKRPFSFQRDIGGIFAKNGCNAADCHGGVKGRGGLKLAINMLHPKDDYKWIITGGDYQVLTPEPAGEVVPRINLEEPEQSLLLLKATFEEPHEGGRRFRVDSPEYRAILEWVKAGAPYREEEEASKVVGLEVFPELMALDPEGEHRLLVTARLADGRREDFSDQVLYETNNREVARVTPEGLVRVVAPGETYVMIRAAGHFVSARVGVIKAPIPDYPDLPRHNFIDDHVFAKLRRLHIVPSELASDEEFIRRLCLDLTGKLPPPERVREFLADEDAQKRDKLIETLLETPEYVAHWAKRLGDLLPDAKRDVALNKPYDMMVWERISAQGYGAASRAYLATYKAKSMKASATQDVRNFLGRRLDCSECHNHPFDTWSQDQYWGMTAFYGRLTSTELREDRLLIDDADGEEIDFGKSDGTQIGFHKPMNPRKKVEVAPTFLDGGVLADELRDDPRLHLADWVVSHPYFAETIANRMWGHFFSRGIVDPVDNFGSTNPPTHPELLAALAKDFRQNGHDLKHLMRRIARSRTYQLSSRPNETNRDDAVNYAHALPRPMEPETLLGAIETVAGASVEAREQFLDAYTDAEKPNLLQALHILVGSTYTEELRRKGGRIDRLVAGGVSNQEIIEEFYLTALSRFPLEDEVADLEGLFGDRSSIVTDGFFDRNDLRRDVVEDLIWALISSREFAYNH